MHFGCALNTVQPEEKCFRMVRKKLVSCPSRLKIQSQPPFNRETGYSNVLVKSGLLPLWLWDLENASCMKMLYNGFIWPCEKSIVKSGLGLTFSFLHLTLRKCSTVNCKKEWKHASLPLRVASTIGLKTCINSMNLNEIYYLQLFQSVVKRSQK